MITADDQVRARGCRANETDRAPFWISKLFPEADSKRRRRMIDLTLRSDPFNSTNSTSTGQVQEHRADPGDGRERRSAERG